MAVRTVRFYELRDEDGQRLDDDIDFDALRAAVVNLPDDEAYVQLSRFEVLGSAYNPRRGRRPAVPMLMLDRITRDVGLRIERRRGFRPLDLDDEDNLADPTYASFFPGNVCAIMRNSGIAPGPASMRDYLNDSGLLSAWVDIAPLTDRDFLRRLHNIETITRFTFAVGENVTADALGDGDSLFAPVLRHYRNRLGNVSVEVSVKLSPIDSRTVSDEEVLPEVEDLVADASLDSFTKARIQYRRLEDGRADSFDFLKESVAIPMDVELEDGRREPTERSASEAIAKAYEDLREDIQSALNEID